MIRATSPSHGKQCTSFLLSNNLDMETTLKNEGDKERERVKMYLTLQLNPSAFILKHMANVLQLIWGNLVAV